MSATANEQPSDDIKKETKTQSNDDEVESKGKGSSYEGGFFKDFYNSQGNYDASAEEKHDKQGNKSKSRVVICVQLSSISFYGVTPTIKIGPS